LPKAYRRIFRRTLRKSRKRVIRYGILTANVALLLAVTGFVLKNPSSGQTARQSSVAGASSSAQAGPLDEISSADIAVNVARITRLDEATSVTNHADSVNAQLALSSSDESVVVKPQVVATALKSYKDIQTYVAVKGDTISSIATKFGITSDSVRWSNNLTGDSVAVGKQLLIPPVSGIVYTVKSGDTPESLARRFNANREQIIASNDAEVSGLKVGTRILIPDGVVPVVRAATRYYGFAFGGSAIYGYNGYDYGWCTWWAAKRRADIGRPVPANLGDAYTWYYRAPAAGLRVGSTPAYGAVIWSNTRYPGHVGFVEKVLSDGSIWVSDMNSHGVAYMQDGAPPAGGWNHVSYRHVYPSDFGRFKFIY
jgi:surface antigen